MAVVEELIRVEEDGSISFGNDSLAEKTKKSDFEVNGDLYKVKTFSEITKLEKNEQFVYESVPGTVATRFQAAEEGVSFYVEGAQDANITLELEESTEYEVIIDEIKVSDMKTNLGGKLSISVELGDGRKVAVRIVKKAQ
ncbi:MAG: endosialidase [Lachnospiraceae bacterium]|nr:endosialidase [Lachnospiraceae bacterium]